MELWRVIKNHPVQTAVSLVVYVGVLVVLAYISVSGCSDSEVASGACTAWLWANSFWPSFYGNLMSTIAGAAIALWVALYLNGLSEADRRRKEREEEDRRRATQAKLHQDELERERRQRDADREAEERQRRLRAADDLDRRVAMLRLVAEEIDALRELLPQVATAVRGNQAVSLAFDMNTWKAISPELLPMLMGDDQGREAARRISALMQGYQITASGLWGAVEDRRRFVGGVMPMGHPSANIVPMAHNIDVDIAQADNVKTLLESLVATYEEQAARLRG